MVARIVDERYNEKTALERYPNSMAILIKNAILTKPCGYEIPEEIVIELVLIHKWTLTKHNGNYKRIQL